MEKRINTIQDNELNDILFSQKLEEQLSQKLGLPSLRSGNIVLRDERNWRTNERQIEYCWLINVSRSFVGWCWIFTIKFNETKFRDILNPEETIQGIFRIDKDGQITDLFIEHHNSFFQDPIKDFKHTDLYTANRGITLDGISYKYIIFAPNTEIRLSLNNPHSENWKNWEKIVRQVGADLTGKSGSKEIWEIFN
jgi:hypothetical protein